jgi:glutaconyl-CoA/methylmalonyl-CoA decarboxylase subunit gamma
VSRVNRYVVTVRGRELTVLVTPLPNGRFVARVEGTADPIEVTLRGDAVEAVATVGRESLELWASGNDVTVRGEPKPVRVETRDAGNRAKSTGKGSLSGTVRAPMPGRVVKVLVEPGATVAKGTGVVVVEAMKMENELSSSVPGVVEKVFVSAGDAVERGAPLVEIR